MARQAVRLNQKVLEEVKAYRQALKAAKIPITSIIIFGSQAKKTSHPGSDIDVAVISPRFGKDYHKDLIKLIRLRGSRFTMIEPHPLHPCDLNDRWSTFVQEVKKYGIVIR
ncbi:MAG: nucleotidyltransferase domain-containing protein [Firmicutes bacterium]|nr:nucleotidyltransferase domain-containing protein [Bacillota bacterium]